MLGINISDFPKGRITSLSFYFLSMYFGHLSFKSPENISSYFYMSMSLLSLIICVFIYTGFLPCKERLSKGDNNNG